MDRPDTAQVPDRATPLEWVTSVMNAAGSCLILVIMAVILVDIVGRFVANKPLPGTPEIVAMSIAAIVFLQFPSTLRARRVIFSDSFLNLVARRSVALEQGLLAVYHLLGGVMFSLVARAVWPLLVKVYEGGHYYGVLAVFTFPKWPVFSIILLGCALMALQYYVLAWRYAVAAAQRRRLFVVDEAAEAVDKVID